jgi:ABC-2 type transport system permease protein
MTVAYTRFELLRMFRNRRFTVFAFGFPLLIYILIAAPNRDTHDLGGSGLSAPLYFMVGLLALGTMNAMLASGTRIAAEKSAGWNRQLRITPLPARVYFRTKVLTGYVMSLISIALLYLAGTALGVRLPAAHWIEMTGLILAGLLPFAALGILLGHLLNTDSIGPAIGGITSLLAFLGGSWYPLGDHGAFHAIGESLPSYWLVEAAHVGAGGHTWGALGWSVITAWTVGAAILARRAYLRDTQRA